MFWRMIVGASVRQKKKMLMIAFTIALGASLATAMLNVMFDVGDKVNRELKTYGANISVVPKAASLLDDLYGLGGDPDVSKYLAEAELGNLKTIFWAYNIVDFAPFLEVKASLVLPSALQASSEIEVVGTWFDKHLELPTGETLDTGIRGMKSWWEVRGEWVSEDDAQAAMVGSRFAEKYGVAPGDGIEVTALKGTRRLLVKGVFNSGGEDDERIFIPLKTAQELSDRKGLVSRLEVSALTTPDNDLARRAAQNIKSLSIHDYEIWYCTAYVSSICYQIAEVITGSVAKPIRQVAEGEGAILEKTRLLMLLITLLSLLGSALAISNLVTASVMERSPEIGLLKAVGAGNASIALLILAEITVAGIAGGVVGYFAGLGFAEIIGRSVFGSSIDIKPTVIPLVAILVTLVTLAGSLPSLRLLLSLRPTEVLHGR
jgi:putative ABC transport system permease protein